MHEVEKDAHECGAFAKACSHSVTSAPQLCMNQRAARK